MDRILEGSDLCGYLTQAVDVILCLDISVLQVSMVLICPSNNTLLQGFMSLYLYPENVKHSDNR